MKKYLPFIIGGVILVVLLVGGFLFIKIRSKPAPKPTKKIEEAVNIVPVPDRPYVTLAPTVTSKHPQGKEVEVTIHTSTLDSTEAEYELEYQAGSLLQGAFGSVDFSSEPPPVSKVLLLGTCSAGGKCDYNQDVAGGTLLVRMSGGQQKFAVKGDWSYGLMSEREGKFSSRDSKFRVDVGAKGLPADAWVIIMQTMGLPEMPKDDILFGPYNVSAGNSKLSAKTVELSARLGETTATPTLLSWSGTKWIELDSEVAEGVLTAEVNSLGTFVIVTTSEE